MRRFLAILLMFLSVFVLFQGLLLSREYTTDADTNPYVFETGLRAFRARRIQEMEDVSALPPDAREPYALYLGDSQSAHARIIQEWAYYTGRIVCFSESLTLPEGTELPYMILVSPEALSTCAETLIQLADSGVDMLCLALPAPEIIEKSSALRTLLGIQSIRAKRVALRGIHLFPGFFLGGERIFETGADDPRQDLALTVPWYRVRSNTKTYMRGTLSRGDLILASANQLKNEDFPAILWRNHLGSANIYAINGNYFDNRDIALGIMMAVLNERGEYLLYPVVNAQVFSMINFPIGADENIEETVALYGRGITKFESDIIRPQLQSLAARYGFKTSCFMAPKYDYNDPAPSQKGLISDYLGTLYDIGGELALSACFRGDSTLSAVLDADAEYYLGENTAYPFCAAFACAEDAEEVAAQMREHSVWQSIRTLALSNSADFPLLGYAAENTTYQQVTNDALFHSFTDELELIALQTALAYENMSLYMDDVFWPASEQYQWHNASREASGNISTQNVPFQAFDRVTISESDARVRTFLSLAYDQELVGNTLRLTVSNVTDTAYFVLRLHGQEVRSVSGGQAKKIEDNAYLIAAEQENVEIELMSELQELFQVKGVY